MISDGPDENRPPHILFVIEDLSEVALSKDKRNASAAGSWTVYGVAAVLAAVAGFFAVYVNSASEGNRGRETGLTGPSAPASGDASSGSPLAGLNSGAMASFLVRDAPQEMPAFDFSNGAGERVTLEAWRGKVVLLNLWATWCLPCLKEMPALERLMSEIDDPRFDVVAISVDRGGIEKPRKFLAKIGAEKLSLYHEGSGTLGHKLKAVGMPTSILIDGEGREIGRLVGPAEWDSAEAVSLMRAAVEASKGGS